jgi:hypothetical protein
VIPSYRPNHAVIGSNACSNLSDPVEVLLDLPASDMNVTAIHEAEAFKRCLHGVRIDPLQFRDIGSICKRFETYRQRPTTLPSSKRNRCPMSYGTPNNPRCTSPRLSMSWLWGAPRNVLVPGTVRLSPNTSPPATQSPFQRIRHRRERNDPPAHNEAFLCQVGACGSVWPRGSEWSDLAQRASCSGFGLAAWTREAFLFVVPDPAFCVCDASSLSCR